MGDKSHVWRMFGFLALVLLLGAAAQHGLRPESWGVAGPYRFESVREVRDLEIVHQDNGICGECHDDILELHDKDIHVHVKCEVCHGPGNLHVRYLMEEDEGITEDEAVMPREYTLEGCLYCHRKLAARPAGFPQIDPAEHYAFLHVVDPTTRCIECHSPHEPLFLLTRVDEARIHPVISECQACHLEPVGGDHRDVEDHPTLFLCEDCHPAVTADARTREHSFLRCTACHLFHRENETAGRIFKNGNRRFCLLCHEEAPFKDGGAVPLISPEDHIPQMAEFFDEDPGTLQENPRACLTCHYENIHDRDLVERRGEPGHE